MSKAVANQLAIQISELVDVLISTGAHPGDVSYALAVALAMTFKVHGSGDISTVKALTCETIDSVWAADDATQAELHSKHRGN